MPDRTFPRPPSASRHASARRQSGQALIVILAFSALLSAGLFFIYNTAQLSTAKLELVNAADASAYSGAAIIAQGLNYTAYTNRAMLANNAAIGQMMALRSTLAMSQWYWKNTETTWTALQALTRFIPYIGAAVSSMAGGVAKFSDFWGNKVVYPGRMLAEVMQTTGSAALGLSNQVMWLSQQVHLADSLGTFEPSMLKIAKANAPEAEVDWALHGTAFGPLMTLGMFASEFKVKVRKSHRTLGTHQAIDDDYLNYLTETNRNVTNPAYVGGRSLLPNAIGLWIATGCDSGASAAIGGASGLFAPAAGMGTTADTIIRTLDTFTSLLSVIVNPLMCLYERQGGTELVQLEDGKMAWASVDAMAFKVPLIDWRIPFAGGANMSFTAEGQSQQPFPADLRYFETRIQRDTLLQNTSAKKYWGNQNEQPADCVEYLRPGSWDMYAISTDTRTTGSCAVLATGYPGSFKDKGLYAGGLKDTTRKILRSKNGLQSTAGFIQTLTAPLQGAMNAASGELQAQLNLPAAQAPNPNPVEGAIPMPPGVSGQVDSSTTALPDTAALGASGRGLASSSWMSGVSGVKSSLLGLAQRLNPANFTQLDATQVFQAAAAGSPGGTGTDGGPDGVTRFFLRLLGLDGIVDLMSMKVADGVEAPRNRAMNAVLNTLADGLPPYFWDVRAQKPVQGRKPIEREDLQVTDADAHDYDKQRYNLGPVVYLPLIKGFDKVKTAENTGRGGKMLGLPDYDGRRNVMRAIGKARVFFHQPADHWLNRYKTVVTSSLILPYWQVRNEGLSYADKWGLLALDGATNVIADVKE